MFGMVKSSICSKLCEILTFFEALQVAGIDNCVCNVFLLTVWKYYAEVVMWPLLISESISRV